MKPQTVTEMRKRMEELERQGYGDHILLISNDEECNGYHELYGQTEGTGPTFRYCTSLNPKKEFKQSPTILFY
ncbi:MAG: hypothetical protein IJ640_00120 [Prevotella sp.]|nr:hypothetical protein [Prevotella sp.]